METMGSVSSENPTISPIKSISFLRRSQKIPGMSKSYMSYTILYLSTYLIKSICHGNQLNQQNAFPCHFFRCSIIVIHCPWSISISCFMISSLLIGNSFIFRTRCHDLSACCVRSARLGWSSTVDAVVMSGDFERSFWLSNPFEKKEDGAPHVFSKCPIFSHHQKSMRGWVSNSPWYVHVHGEKSQCWPSRALDFLVLSKT